MRVEPIAGFAERPLPDGRGSEAPLIRNTLLNRDRKGAVVRRILQLALASVLALLLLAGCVRAPDSYPPPIQRKPLPDLEESPSDMLVNMSDANAAAHFVRDISPGLEGGRWRWANERPELKFFLESAKGLKLVWDFSVAEVTFRETGPVTVSFFVNGQPAGRLPCPKPGDYKYEQPVRQDLVRTNEYNTIAAQADKLWVSPTDGAKLGFTMTRAGFLR